MRLQSSVATAVCVIAIGAACVSAIRWDTAFTDGGNLFYPGVGVTFRFWAASDVRFDTTGLGSNTPVYVDIGSKTSPILYPGNVTNYFDGWLLAPPKANTATVYFVGQNASICSTGPKPISPYTFQTLVISGSLAGTIHCEFELDLPRWYMAEFRTGFGPGAWHHTSLWAFPQAGDRMVEVFVPIQSGSNLIGYIANAPVMVNVSASDSRDGEFRSPVLWTGAQPANTPYFNLAPFFYQIRITNNQGLLSQGSTVQMTGAGLDVTSSYACVWNNTENSMIVSSPAANPTSSTTFTCQFPDALATLSNNGDDITLINVTTVATTNPLNGGWIPFASNSGYQPKFRYQYPIGPTPPGPDTGSPGLTGGQIFGIILAVFVGAALLGYGGFRLYKRHVDGTGGSSSTFGYDQPSDSVDNKPKQIQYNPQAVSYQSNDV